MLESAKAFMRACDEKGLKYRDPRDLDSGKSKVTLGVTGSAGNTYEVQYVFDDDNESVWLYVPGLLRTDKEHYAQMLIACNRLNNQYRWLKFILDKDMDICIETDAVIDLQSVGPVCTELFYRIMSITKSAYPTLMKIQWGGANG